MSREALEAFEWIVRQAWSPSPTMPSGMDEKAELVRYALAEAEAPKAEPRRCGLPECQGKARCEPCRMMDIEYGAPKAEPETGTYLDQIAEAKRDTEQWPQWMKDAAQVSAAVPPKQGGRLDESDFLAVLAFLQGSRGNHGRGGRTMSDNLPPPLKVPSNIASAMTTEDLAWLETRRIVRIWKELGTLQWMGADEGWDRAIEAVRARLDKECEDVLAWKAKVDASGEAAAQLLRQMKEAGR